MYNFQGCGRRDMDEPLGTNLDCYVDMPNIPFRTGRTDCDSGAKPYIGKKSKNLSSPDKLRVKHFKHMTKLL